MVINWHRDPTDSPLLPQSYTVYLDTVNPPVTIISSGTQTTVHTGLAMPTTYYLQIVPYGLNNIANTLCNVVTFAVPDSTPAFFPYYEDFEHGPGGWESSANPANPNGLKSSWAFGTPGTARQFITTAPSGNCLYSNDNQ